LLELFFKNQSVESMTNPSMNELKSQFLGSSDQSDLMDSRCILLKNQSNFMQGIYHYSSSLFHSAHLFWVKNKVNAIIKRHIESTHPDVADDGLKIMTLTMCSSDDAGRITTVLFNSKTEAQKKLIEKDVKKILTWTSFFLLSSYAMIGVKPSLTKSTICVLNMIYEFNSVWYFRNTIMLPLIKWSRACCDYKISTNSTDRMLTDMNSLKDLYNAGCSTFTVRCHEIGCILNHYDCLGMYTSQSDLWHTFMDDHLKIKHPLCWYYIRSHPKISVLLGYGFSLYHHLIKDSNSISRIVDSQVRMKMCSESPEDSYQSVNSSLLFGNLRKYYKFLQESGIRSRSELADQVIKRPSMMLESSGFSKDELRVKIELNAIKPGVSDGFIMMTSANQHRSSCYIHNTPCIRVTQRDGTHYRSLVSLQRWILSLVASEQEPKMEDYVNTDRFQNSLVYDNILKDIDQYDLVRSFDHIKRRVPFDLRIPVVENNFQITLTNVLRRKWFSMDNNKSVRMTNLVFDKYQTVLPWLSDTFESSLSNFQLQYPNTDVLSMFDSIQTFESKEKSVKILHRGPVKRSFYPGIISMIRFSYGVRGFLSKGSSKTADVRSDGIEPLLMRLVSGPTMSIQSGLALKHVFRLAPKIHDVVVTDRNAAVQIMTWMFQTNDSTRGELDSDQCLRLYSIMTEYRQGKMSWWIRPQTRREDKWVGRGQYALIIDDVKMIFEVEDDTLVSVKCSNPIRSMDYISIINTTISRQLGCKICTTNRQSGIKMVVHNTATGFYLGKVGSSRSDNLLIQPMTSDLIPPTSLRYMFNLSDNKLNLKVLSPNMRDHEHAQISFSYRPQNLLVPLTTDIPNNVFDQDESNCSLPESIMVQTWMGGKSLPRNVFMPLLISSERDDKTKLRDWIRQTFLSRLNRTRNLPRHNFVDRTLIEDLTELREEELVSSEDPIIEVDEFDMMLFGDDEMEMVRDQMEDLGEEEETWERIRIEDELSELSESSLKTFSEVSQKTFKRMRVLELADGATYWDDVIKALESSFSTKISEISWLPSDGSVPDSITRFLLFCGFKQKPASAPNPLWE
jgi:hypothetical protein